MDLGAARDVERLAGNVVRPREVNCRISDIVRGLLTTQVGPVCCDKAEIVAAPIALASPQ
jgi:hypothetical protein